MCRFCCPAISRSCFIRACGTRILCWGRWRGSWTALGIHLLIDSDTCRSASIRVPTGSVNNPRVEAVAYDEPMAEVPHEERMIRDVATFSTFAERSASLVRPLLRIRWLRSLWPLVMGRNPSQKNLGLRLAQGRHALEETWQNETLELPQSAVCELPEFGWFVAHLLANLPRFWAAYNDALAHYRRAHRIRGHAQPVPDLACVGRLAGSAVLDLVDGRSGAAAVVCAAGRR